MPFCKASLFHTWGQWTIIGQTALYRRNSQRGLPIEGSERIVGTVLDQHRTCIICGFTQSNRQETKTKG
jgi:hypothetical protein